MERPTHLVETTRPVPWTSAQWSAYFQANAGTLLDIPWGEGVRLTEAERAAVARSVQDFQLGESSEGLHLMRAALAYADEAGDEDYPEAVLRFIREEQRHAHDLGRFLTLAGVPLLQRSWTDSLFRWLRRRAGLGLFLTVLVTAEMIGKVYYKALRGATGSAVLRRLCDQLLRDEIKHVRFHVERLAMMRQGRPAWRRLLGRAGHHFLFAGTSLVVGWKHRRVLWAGGYGFIRFWREAWRELRTALRPIPPADLALPVPCANRVLPVG